MRNINRIPDKLIKKTFKNLENTKAFLEIALPEPLRNVMDFSRLTIDNTNYVSDTFKESFADIVVKTKMRGGSEDKDPKEIDADTISWWSTNVTGKRQSSSNCSGTCT